MVVFLAWFKCSFHWCLIWWYTCTLYCGQSPS